MRRHNHLIYLKHLSKLINNNTSLNLSSEREGSDSSDSERPPTYLKVFWFCILYTYTHMYVCLYLCIYLSCIYLGTVIFCQFFCSSSLSCFWWCVDKLAVKKKQTKKYALPGVAQWIECRPINQKVTKGHWFDYRSGHMHGLQARSSVGGVQEAPHPCISHPLMFLSLSFSLPSILSKCINKVLKIKQMFLHFTQWIGRVQMRNNGSSSKAYSKLLIFLSSSDKNWYSKGTVLCKYIWFCIFGVE